MTGQVEQPQSQLRAAIARGDITPPVGIYHRMWGAALHDRSTAVHRPLTATALALAPRAHAAGADDIEICVGLDHCLFWPREMHEFLDRVARQANVDRSRLSVYFSHTHGAGLMGLERKSLPGGDLIAGYLERCADIVAGLVKQALANLNSATISYGVGRCALATNRDYLDPLRQGFVCGFNPDQTADDLVVVGRISNEHGQLLGTIINYACHPTTLAWDNTQISPDYVGAMREIVETATRVPCLFIQGASGDVGPRVGFVGDTAQADQNGRQLGYAALSALEGMLPANSSLAYAGAVVSGATIGTWKTIPLSQNRQEQSSIWSQQLCEVEVEFR